MTGETLCFGLNSSGQLGDGTNTSRNVPTAALASVPLTTVVTGAPANYTCGLTSTLDLYCWGYNYWGQLGDGTVNNSFVPNKAQLQ